MRSRECLVLLWSLMAAAEPPSAAALAAFERAQKLQHDPPAAIEQLAIAAEGGVAEAQAALGVAYVQGQGGLPEDASRGRDLLRAAALQGHSDATYNLVALCGSRPGCVRGSSGADDESVMAWLRTAADAGLRRAAYELGHLLLRNGSPSAALERFLHAAREGEPSSMYNAAHLAATGGDGASTGGDGAASSLAPDLTLSAVWFARAAAQQDDGKVASDAAVAAPRVRRLWVQRVEASGVAESSTAFEAAREEDGAVAAGSPDTGLAGWRRGAAAWAQFELSFSSHPSYDNAAALSHLRGAMREFEAVLASDPPPGELRRYLLLSKLAEGAKTLGRDPAELERAAAWLEALVAEPLCSELYAELEAQPSCFNDQLAAAVTMRRRSNGTAAAERLVAAGNAHPHAATKWTSAAQTPRILVPDLLARAWWDPSDFELAPRLEAAWADGSIATDLARVLPGAGGAAAGPSFQRIVSSGAPIRAAAGADGGAGVWSEFMLFDGAEWAEERCAAAVTLCGLLRSAAEVAGEVVHADGTSTKPQGQVTIFRLKPGAHVLPHVGVTNRRLVLQFPLRGWRGVRFRVSEEWREYEEGRAMVFDDSFEHEVVHEGAEDRFVLYAVLHHPQLGRPTLGGGPPLTSAAAATSTRSSGSPAGGSEACGAGGEAALDELD